MNFLRQLVTGRDNETHDLGRWSWVGSFVVVVAHAAWSLWHGISVSITDLAQAIATVTGAHGLALWAKKDTEPTKGAQ
jgi:ABC-type nickel/cobalt efflux system permease component RcnA